MRTGALLAEQILPTDAQILGLLAFILLIAASLVSFAVGLKMTLGPRKRLGTWMLSLSAALLVGIAVFVVTR